MLPLSNAGGNGRSEDIDRNPLMVSLRAHFLRMYLMLCERGGVLLLPVASSLNGVKVTQVLIECHILFCTHIPGHFLNLIGQGVELRERRAFTSFGFKEERHCNVVQEDSLFDNGCTFKVVCVDEPIQILNPAPLQAQSCTTRLKSSTTSSMESVEFTVHGWFQNREALEQNLDRFLGWKSICTSVFKMWLHLL
eukprot:TRINITY_DN51265_c0_g1_i1.p1 TRINITY_DN51265_c0_g1~~TRINITY_DN51265_c0_g1_i1.p1  ORF type:complete len:194 (-),score=10.10 TRINITY_DN51265_c0_g1_i1:642-1223(-)